MNLEPLPSARTGKDSRVLAAVERLAFHVNRTCGLRPGDQLEKRLQRLVRTVPSDQLGLWVARLEGLPAGDPEWTAFVEQLTVHETYFFRERDQLELWRERHLMPLLESRRREGRRDLRIWSAGCSTGEEAYTVAILLLESLVALGEAREEEDAVRLLQPWTVTILGTDLARPAIQHAERSVYRSGAMSSFRDLPRSYLRFFDELEGQDAATLLDGFSTGPLRRVRRDVRGLVRFAVHNLAEGKPALPLADTVLCRNVLIYFDDATRMRTVDTLVSALLPGGALLLGTTDLLACEGLAVERCPTALFHRRVYP